MNILALIGAYVAVGLIFGTACYTLDFFFGDGTVIDSSFIKGGSFWDDYPGVLFLGPMAAPLCVFGFFLIIAASIKLASKNHWKSPWTLRREYREARQKWTTPCDNECDERAESPGYQLALGERWIRRAKGL